MICKLMCIYNSCIYPALPGQNISHDVYCEQTERNMILLLYITLSYLLVFSLAVMREGIIQLSVSHHSRELSFCKSVMPSA